jgi:hypothetical protein
MTVPQKVKPDFSVVVADVLSSLAFMVVDDEPCAAPADTAWYSGAIAYRGPFSGTVRCWCTQTFALELAANLLGLEPGDPQAQPAALDAVREFLNVLCGQLVTRWYGTEAEFDIGLPTACGQGVELTLPSASAAGVSWLNVGGQPLACAHEPAA